MTNKARYAHNHIRRKRPSAELLINLAAGGLQIPASAAYSPSLHRGPLLMYIDRSMRLYHGEPEQRMSSASSHWKP